MSGLNFMCKCGGGEAFTALIAVLHQHSSAGSNPWIPGPQPVPRSCWSQSSTVIPQYAWCFTEIDSSHGLSRLNSAFRCGGVEEVRWLWHLAVLHQHTVQLGQIMDSWTSTCAQGLLNCLLNICCTCAIVTLHAFAIIAYAVSLAAWL